MKNNITMGASKHIDFSLICSQRHGSVELQHETLFVPVLPVLRSLPVSFRDAKYRRIVQIWCTVLRRGRDLG